MRKRLINYLSAFSFLWGNILCLLHKKSTFAKLNLLGAHLQKRIRIYIILNPDQFRGVVQILRRGCDKF